MMLDRPKHSKQDSRIEKSLPLEDCYAKTTQKSTGEIVPGINVETHCQIVGAVAQLLAKLSSCIPHDQYSIRSYALLAACHDIGKVNPLFQEKIRRNLSCYKANSAPGLEAARPELERDFGPHAYVSQIALKWYKKDSTRISSILGRHHGLAYKSKHSGTAEIFGGNPWKQEREKLIERLCKHFNSDFPSIADFLYASYISGFVTVADWIGSGEPFSNLLYDEDPSEYDISAALSMAGFVPFDIIPNLEFSNIFSFTPNAIQNVLTDSYAGPGLYIVEAGMGMGKTEAALYIAYKLLEQHQATGCYFALPTQLTSEKIYKRFSDFLNKILDPKNKHTPLLLHGKSWLFETELGEEGRIGYSWFDSRKRGLLAPFAVGTIDQALLSIMNVKHNCVRLYGLAGKVVILDEVHSYDTYTGTLMEKLITSLRSLGCTVILLSATLTTSQQQRFLKQNIDSCVLKNTNAYPLITRLQDSHIHCATISHPSEPESVSISCSHDLSALKLLVREKAAMGENVLWIENTVQEAQETYKDFASWGRENNIPVGLIHSRFLPDERSRYEDVWTHRLGKEGITQRTISGAILIGTQVLEQSLDIDADFLVTRLAPMDMLLQRIGRLWRHNILNKIRPQGAERSVIVIVPEVNALLKSPKIALGKSGNVYAPYVLLRTYEILQKISTIMLPEDIRILIDRTYEERTDNDAMGRLKHEMNQRKDILHRLAMNTTSESSPTQNDDVAETRFGSFPTVQIMLLRALRVLPEEMSLLTLIDGSSVLLPSKKNISHKERKKIVKTLMKKTLITVPKYQAPAPIRMEELSWMSSYLYVSDEPDERIRLGIVTESGTIMSKDKQKASKIFDLSYLEGLGYIAKKNLIGEEGC
ncbi:CRISPR-associated helicase/endonuclease Cas3 [Parasphaerochaeta coccoides]|uniref:CRISPR-associated helicase Cas3 n=1 Tax=Parasphaerochaeta coccoides (strain ATCC BAA-1237 / DSM 17374 / SPN1) TaxID=760011 RepID=F4GL06_PARC1|nr:CRISPR-associated helicase/endonuclease Cas3 [Parasphaerochaeta coccoides]AEC02346.1 CRISPR-associated helicase Cas3 [Parasphaerochaeta coccoides DSM 17374]